MNTILFHPTDILFFRDGRPMTGSLAGHTAAWPLPDVTNHALHAALHRAEIESVHSHRHGRSGVYATDHRDRKFGCLTTAGPFPVRIRVNLENNLDAKNSARKRCTWFFPRPADAGKRQSVEVTFLPVRPTNRGAGVVSESSSLPLPLRYATGNIRPPDKEADGERWLSVEAFSAYLHGTPIRGAADFATDSDIADREAQLGIEIDPTTQTTGQGDVAGKIYTAHYLRLREDSDTRWSLGLFAEAQDKVNGDATHRRDLIDTLFRQGSQQLVVGGQQRICTAERWPNGEDASVRVPRGLSGNFETAGSGADKRWLVKWVLLTPAIWPQIQADPSRNIHAHPGGWLPNWVFVKWNPDTEKAEADDRNGRVLLTDGPGVRKSRRRGVAAGRRIAARLVAAMVPKPLTVTGWALPSEEAERPEGGAKSTHLAVPAGAVYYFEAESAEAGASLAVALNWHGSTQGIAFRNRRSTLLGEKGYGLGVCGTWNFFEDVAGRPTH